MCRFKITGSSMCSICFHSNFSNSTMVTLVCGELLIA
uniref:Uncharacterized protein n=1 Tax=Arundo donax TaxID=35708 RepID=A0A0A8Z1Z1_ARUDO